MQKEEEKRGTDGDKVKEERSENMCIKESCKLLIMTS